MGAWGHGTFENDSVLDWVNDLVETEDLWLVRAALDAVTDNAADYLEIDESSAALGAAEVVAALAGKPSPDLPKEIVEWLDGERGVSSDLLNKARRGVEAVLTRSELQELWEESDHYDAWKGVLNELRSRLSE